MVRPRQTLTLTNGKSRDTKAANKRHKNHISVPTHFNPPSLPPIRSLALNLSFTRLLCFSCLLCFTSLRCFTSLLCCGMWLCSFLCVSM